MHLFPWSTRTAEIRQEGAASDKKGLVLGEAEKLSGGEMLTEQLN